MPAASPEPLALLERAAELRARGRSWDEAATKLSLGHDELRRLVAEYSHDYERLVRRARAEAQRDTVSAAMAALADLAQSADTRTRLAASTTICRYEIALKRYGSKDADARL